MYFKNTIATYPHISGGFPYFSVDENLFLFGKRLHFQSDLAGGTAMDAQYSETGEL